MKVLVTGGNGFVGSALVRRLRQVPGWDAVSGVRTLPVDRDDDGTLFELGDLAEMAASLPLEGFDVIVHCAARAHVMNETEADALKAYMRANAEATAALAERAAACGVGKFVLLSSIKVNGESQPAGQPFRADDPPRPTDPYGRSKLEAEIRLKGISRRTGMAFTIVRPPLVYGPGVRANFLTMVRWVSRGIPLPLGAVRNKRSLVSIDNLTDFLLKCLTQKASDNQTFLVSDAEDLATPELLRRIGGALGRPARLVPIPASVVWLALAAIGRSGFYDRLFGSLQVDIDKSRHLLGWTPPFSVDEGLAKVAAWYKCQS